MELIPVKTPIIRPGDNLIEIFQHSLSENNITLQNGDIVVIAETVVATSQRRIINEKEITEVSEKAHKISKKYEMRPKFVELILQEADKILGGVTGVLLTEKYGVPIANAGIDESNSGGSGNYVLMPEKPFETAVNYRNQLKIDYNMKDLGLIITDSRVQPMKRGTIGVAFAVAGFEPVEKCQGKRDLFDRELIITERAIADDISSAAQLLMGESNQQIPIVIVRNIEVKFTDNDIAPTEMLIDRNRCLFMNVFEKAQNNDTI